MLSSGFFFLVGILREFALRGIDAVPACIVRKWLGEPWSTIVPMGCDSLGGDPLHLCTGLMTPQTLLLMGLIVDMASSDTVSSSFWSRHSLCYTRCCYAQLYGTVAEPTGGGWRRLSLLLMLFVSVNVGCAEFSDDVTDMGIAVDAAVSVQRISDLVDDASVDAGMSVDADVSLPDAEVVCDQPGRVGLCMFCDTNGNVFQPETNQDCPELTCLSLVEFDDGRHLCVGVCSNSITAACSSLR